MHNYEAGDDDWGNSLDDQDSEFWEMHLGGPDDSYWDSLERDSLEMVEEQELESIQDDQAPESPDSEEKSQSTEELPEGLIDLVMDFPE